MCLKAAKVEGLAVLANKTVGSSHGSDIDCSYKRRPFRIQVKLDLLKAQMGGGSLHFQNGLFTVTKRTKMLDARERDLVLKAAMAKKAEIEWYIAAAKTLEPRDCHALISGIPLKVAKGARDTLEDAGLLKSINTSAITDASFIARHYNHQGVFYINIGGAGLFYMGDDPLHLGVPELKGTVNIEIRLGFGGKRLYFDTPAGKIEARSAGLRLQARMLSTQVSGFNLDNVSDIQRLFAKPSPPASPRPLSYVRTGIPIEELLKPEE